MTRLAARSIAPAAGRWLEDTTAARILHLFRRACNLVNETGEILSLVTPDLGNGPFAIVLEPIDFEAHLTAGSPIHFHPGHFTLGPLEIHTATAKLWQPIPDWYALASSNSLIGYAQIVQSLLAAEAPPDSLAALQYQPATTLAAPLATRARATIAQLAQPATRAEAAHALAGLGPGLTPAGDDFLVGFMHAAWACQPQNALSLCEPLAARATPRTHALSRAWLTAAARGEAGEVWHTFLKTLTQADKVAVLAAARHILPTGHTSGADALAGFLHGLAVWR